MKTQNELRQMTTALPLFSIFLCTFMYIYVENLIAITVATAAVLLSLIVAVAQVTMNIRTEKFQFLVHSIATAVVFSIFFSGISPIVSLMFFVLLSVLIIKSQKEFKVSF